jgi:pimeloyl-ACP methyl ester carboxylesterase
MAEDMTGVLGSLPGAPVIIGASLTGLTGLILVGERPGAVRALVLVDAVPRVEHAGARRISEFMRSAPDGFESLAEAAAGR